MHGSSKIVAQVAGGRTANVTRREARATDAGPSSQQIEFRAQRFSSSIIPKFVHDRKYMLLLCLTIEDRVTAVAYVHFREMHYCSSSFSIYIIFPLGA